MLRVVPPIPRVVHWIALIIFGSYQPPLFVTIPDALLHCLLPSQANMVHRAAGAWAYPADFPPLRTLVLRDIMFLRRPEDIARPLNHRKGNTWRQGLVPVSLRIQKSKKALSIAEAHKHEVIRLGNRSEHPESTDQFLCRGITGMHIVVNEPRQWFREIRVNKNMTFLVPVGSSYWSILPGKEFPNRHIFYLEGDGI